MACFSWLGVVVLLVNGGGVFSLFADKREELDLSGAVSRDHVYRTLGISLDFSRNDYEKLVIQLAEECREFAPKEVACMLEDPC